MYTFSVLDLSDPITFKESPSLVQDDNVPLSIRRT